jgi:hypothetical protein
MYMINFLPRLHISGSNDSSVIATKRRAKYKFHATAIFCISHSTRDKDDLNKSLIFLDSHSVGTRVT